MIFFAEDVPLPRPALSLNHACHMALLDNLEITEDMMAYLLQEGVLSTYDNQRIQEKITIPYKANIMFLSILRQKPDTAYQHLIKSLNISNQSHLADMLIFANRTQKQLSNTLK